MSWKSMLVIVLAVLVIAVVVKFGNLQQAPVYNFSQPFESPLLQSNQVQQLPSSVGAETNLTSTDNTPDIPDAVILDEGNNSFTLVEYVSPACGDSVCDAGEDCSTCGDCACASNESCTTYGVCLARERCGDGVCTSVENSTRSCCTDCGCVQGTLCNENIPACLPIVQFTPQKLNESIATALALPEFQRYTFIEAYDDYYENKVVKTIVLRCPGDPDFDCEGYVHLNSQGQVVGTSHTT